MQIQTFSGKVISTEVVKSYTDFQNASTSKTVDILTLTTNSVIVGLEIDLNPFFGGVDKNHFFLSVNNGLVINKNISSPTQLVNPYKNLIVEPSLITAGISPYTIQATVASEGNGGWSFSGNLNYSFTFAQSGFGIQTAAVCFGGYDSSATYKNTTEEYNGNNWTTSGTLSQGRSHLAGCGTILAGLSIGGWIVSGVVATCEEYNGASWSAGGNLNIARHNSGSAGTQIAGLAFGGYESNTTEEYNGTSWTSSGNMNVLTEASGGCGIQTDALSINGTYRNSTEEYNGTSWAVSVNTNFARYHSEGCGTSSQALSFNGASSATLFVLETELFDGISWNIGNNSNLKRDRFAGCGTQSAAAQFGGQDNIGFPTITENWDKAPAQNLTNLTSGNLTFKIKYINYNA